MTSRLTGALAALKKHSEAPVSLESLAVLRIIFGLTMVVGLTRFMLSGWVEELFVRPNFFFKYPGFEWMPVWSPRGLYFHFGLVLAASLLVSLGLFYRASLLIFSLGFLGIQLFDASNYLNHYYLVICIGLVLLIVPANRCWSLDVYFNRISAAESYPALGLWLLRFQVGIVYVFAAIAKLGEDWLLHAQPLSIWLSARQDWPLIGPLLDSPYTAYAMSWGGLIYDASIVFFLLHARTRSVAYIFVIIFHALTLWLFDIGMFPIIMIGLTTIFFDPAYPRRFVTPQQRTSAIKMTAPFSKWALTGVAMWCFFHVAMPLRQLYWEGDVLWSEQGMRYSWRVMVREKMGSITYLVTRRSDGRVFEVSPTKYLEPRQMSEMSGQPDLIRQLAFHVKKDFEDRHGVGVEVRTRALVSLNGRPAAELIDPNVDLTDPELYRHAWRRPKPTEPPLSAWGNHYVGTRKNK